MNTTQNTSNARLLFLWIAMIAVACVVYATGISHESIWYDEAYSSVMAGHPLSQIVYWTTFDNHPPLYYLLLGAARLLLGNSEWALRTLSVLGAVGLVSLGAGPVRRVFGDKIALIYAGVVLFTPAILTYAHEARMYTLAIFCVTAGALYGYLAARSHRTRDWVYFGMATLGAAYLHYYGLIAAFFMHVGVLLWLLFKKREQLKAGLITGAAVFLGYLPWLIVFIRQTLMIHKGFWLGPPNLQSVLLAFLQPFAYKEIYPTVLPTMFLAALIAPVLAVTGIVIVRLKRAEQESSFSLFLLFIYLGTLVTTILVSLFLMPIFYSRYMLVCLGLLLLLVSLGIGMLPGKYLPVIALGIFAFANIFTLKNIYTQKFNHPMKDLAAKLDGAVQPGDLIITSDSYSMGPATYYFPQADHYYSNNFIEAQWGTVLKAMTPPIHYEEGLDKLLTTHKSFWYITCSTRVAKRIEAIVDVKQGWEKSGGPITVGVPTSYAWFTAQKYIYTGRVDPHPRGTLNVHITGLKPVGEITFLLYDDDPILRDMSSYYHAETLPVTGQEITYSLVDLEYRNYVLIAFHDENQNHSLDIDPKTQLPSEGIFIYNSQRLDSSHGLERFMDSIRFYVLNFRFDQLEQTIEAEMTYPPFGSNNK